MEPNTLWSSAFTGSECHHGNIHPSHLPYHPSHLLSLCRLRSLSLQVDEEHRKSVSLLPSGSSRLSPALFFIGGLPQGEESRLPMKLQELSRSFRGCIQHLVVEGV